MSATAETDAATPLGAAGAMGTDARGSASGDTGGLAGVGASTGTSANATPMVNAGAAASVGAGANGLMSGHGAAGSMSTAADRGMPAGSGGSTERRWVGTWSASPYPAAADAQPPGSLSNAVLRQVVHVSLGGNQLRVLFSNLSRNGTVAIKTAHVALCMAPGAVDSTIDASSDRALAFSGVESVSIARGREVWSDPLTLSVAPLANIAISIAFEEVPSTLTAHAGSRTTSYYQAGSSDVSAASMASAKTTDHWYFISGIDVLTEVSARAVAVIGDSITDGRGTDTNENDRWTDVLAARLQASTATANVAVLNQGIGATTLVGSGTAAEARFNRDVLGQSGVKYAIVFDGVNDIGGGVSFQSMRTVYDELIAAAHAKGLLIYGATILPFGGNTYYSPAHEMVREQVNAFIRGGAFDGYIDFDAALSDGGNPPKLQATYAAWTQADGLHPGPAGYRKMGETVELTLFTR